MMIRTAVCLLSLLSMGCPGKRNAQVPAKAATPTPPQPAADFDALLRSGLENDDLLATLIPPTTGVLVAECQEDAGDNWRAEGTWICRATRICSAERLRFFLREVDENSDAREGHLCVNQGPDCEIPSEGEYNSGWRFRFSGPADDVYLTEVSSTSPGALSDQGIQEFESALRRTINDARVARCF